GERKWKNEDVWPPLSNKDHTYYLSDGEGLYTDQRTDKTFSYIYNPNDPSPTIGGKNLHDDLDQGPYDLTDSVESRGDVAIFTTEALESNLSVKGKIEVKLYVSSDRKDTDFAIRLSEVYSDGRSILLLDGIQRMRFRDGFAPSDTSAMNPGTVYPITIVLDDISNTFLKGNKIRLIVSSSNYPRYNRNMNTNGEMYPDDNPDTLVNPLVASNTIYTGTTYPSQIIFPVDTSDAAEIQVISSDNTISVYPNPSSGKFMITGAPNNSKFQVYNVSGQLVIESNNPRISMEDFEPGTYLIKIQSDDKTFTKKIIIQ
ncbi:MAG: CocE/NonD family hydrolase, partial [Bacteroidia bacterium]|nr:CocE/NonD family hydrolase [Bacteroidia bacterium]